MESLCAATRLQRSHRGARGAGETARVASLTRPGADLLRSGALQGLLRVPRRGCTTCASGEAERISSVRTTIRLEEC
jgi:hypothetical protein